MQPVAPMGCPREMPLPFGFVRLSSNSVSCTVHAADPSEAALHGELPKATANVRLALPARREGGGLALAGVVDRLAQDPRGLLRGVEAHRVLGGHEVEPPLRLAVQRRGRLQ